jgi:[NiFe] hydrogenase assembly HybE family chaperone
VNAWAHSRIQALEQVFVHIASTRMRDVPVQNPVLRVQAVGFVPMAQPGGELLLGMLVTPWFMNLVRLPATAAGSGAAWPPVGHKASRAIGGETFEFIGAHEEGLGAYESCSMFSPMFEFADQAGAVATANEVLNLLRTPAPSPAPMAQAVPSRRGFLLGRGGPRAGANA